jgi:molybdopterin-guanine dinucleotide biosynthesis protein MobB
MHWILHTFTEPKRQACAHPIKKYLCMGQAKKIKLVRGFSHMVSRTQALNLILENVSPLDVVSLPLAASLGAAVAQDIYARVDVPSVDRSAMDGYTLRSQDTVEATSAHPVSLQVAGEIHPSTKKLPRIDMGQAALVMTGGAMPPGADAVVKLEDAEATGTTLIIRRPVPPFQYVSQKGKDIRAGSLVVEKGKPVTPVLLSILASLNITRIEAIRRPAVAVLAIGNELANLGHNADGHKIVASNLYMLSGLIEKAGARIRCAKITKNNEKAIQKDILEGLESDLLITTGGTANAPSDLTRKLMEEWGIHFKFSGVSMLHGKGASFGFLKEKPVLALPGTPTAVFALFHTFVLPALRRLMGFQHPHASGRITAILEETIRKRPGMEHLIPALVEGQGGGYRVRPLIGTQTEDFRAMAGTNGFVLMGPDQSVLEKGRSVPVQLLSPAGPPWSALPEPGQQSRDEVQIPCVSIVGKSDSGKTTLLEKLVPALRAKGYRVGTIKHDTHGFDIDHPGKDTWRHKQAGACTVAISSPAKVAVIKDVDSEQELDSLASKYFQDVDIILTEGYKRGTKPKIEIFRKAVHSEPLSKAGDNLVALVSDTPLDLGVPRFELDDIQGLADLVEREFLAK